jgi:hypothetical protein
MLIDSIRRFFQLLRKHSLCLAYCPACSTEFWVDFLLAPRTFYDEPNIVCLGCGTVFAVQVGFQEVKG